MLFSQNQLIGCLLGLPYSFVDLSCFFLSCVCYAFVRVCLFVPCGHLLGQVWPLGSRLWCLLWVCHFPIGVLGQVWYLIVSIPDLCTLTYFIAFRKSYYCKCPVVLPHGAMGWSVVCDCGISWSYSLRFVSFLVSQLSPCGRESWFYFGCLHNVMCLLVICVSPSRCGG